VDGPGETAELDAFHDIAVDAANNVSVADEGSNRVRKIDAFGNVTTVAGNGKAAHADGTGGPKGTAEFYAPYGLTVDAVGNLYVGDFDDRVRKVDPTGNVVAGTQKNLPATSTVDVNGQELKQADIVAQLQSWIPLFQQVDATNAPYRNALQAVQSVEPAVRQYVGRYGEALRQVFGKGNPLLADFGLSTAQRKTPTPATHVLAAARAVATKKARGTLGKQQRKAIKGAPVTAVTVPSGGQPALSVQASGPETVPAPNPASK
jgi:hypothetical protein